MHRAVMAGLIGIGLALGLSGCTAGSGDLGFPQSNLRAFGEHSGGNGDAGGGGGGGSSGM